MNCQVSEEAAVAKIKDRCGGKAREEEYTTYGWQARRTRKLSDAAHIQKGTYETWFSNWNNARRKYLGTADCLLRGFGSFSFSISIRNPNFKAKAPGKLASGEEWTLNLKHLETWLLASNLSLILTSPLTSLCFLPCHVQRQNPPISGF